MEPQADSSWDATQPANYPMPVRRGAVLIGAVAVVGVLALVAAAASEDDNRRRGHEPKGGPAMTALAVVAGTVLTLGGFAVAVAMSRRAAEKALPQTEPSDAAQESQPPAEPPTLVGFSDEDVEAAAHARKRKRRGSPQLWTEQIGSQLHARKAGETLTSALRQDRDMARKGERVWPGKTRPCIDGKEALPIHRRWAHEVLWAAQAALWQCHRVL